MIRLTRPSLVKAKRRPPCVGIAASVSRCGRTPDATFGKSTFHKPRITLVTSAPRLSLGSDHLNNMSKKIIYRRSTGSGLGRHEWTWQKRQVQHLRKSLCELSECPSTRAGDAHRCGERVQLSHLRQHLYPRAGLAGTLEQGPPI